MKKKIVYVGLAADIVHEGHINILKTAARLGYVIVGLLTDKAIASYKKLPYFEFNQRKIILQNIKYVDQVVEQRTLDYVENLKTKNINKNDKDETLVLLAIKFDEAKKPSGSITLEFSGNKAINLSVENIEVFLTDIGEPWLTAKKPNHDNE